MMDIIAFMYVVFYSWCLINFVMSLSSAFDIFICLQKISYNCWQTGSKVFLVIPKFPGRRFEFESNLGTSEWIQKWSLKLDSSKLLFHFSKLAVIKVFEAKPYKVILSRINMGICFKLHSARNSLLS